jgi:hypothetical protein
MLEVFLVQVDVPFDRLGQDRPLGARPSMSLASDTQGPDVDKGDFRVSPGVCGHE